MDTTKRNWDAEILNFLTCEYSVMENGRSVLSTRFSSVRFLHLLEGEEDFDGKASRVRTLTDAVKSKKGAHQKMPSGPEFPSE